MGGDDSLEPLLRACQRLSEERVQTLRMSDLPTFPILTDGPTKEEFENEVKKNPFDSPPHTPSHASLAPLAETDAGRPESALGAAVLLFLGIRKQPPRFDVNAVRQYRRGFSLNQVQIATQPSVWDTDQAEEYKTMLINPEWENIEAFDPSFRWTWREEKEARRAVDIKVFVHTRPFLSHGAND